MKKEIRFLVFLQACLWGSAVLAAAAQNNCKSRATEISVGGIQTLTLVRDWDEERKGSIIIPADDPSDPPQFIPYEGAWRDGRKDDAPLSEQWGCYCFYVKLTAGKSYVFTMSQSSGCHADISSSAQTRFSSKTKDGTVYYYIRGSEWLPYDSGKQLTYNFRVWGAQGTVGKKVTVSLKEQLIDDIVPNIGTLDTPIDLVVSEDGSTVVAAPLIDKEYGYDPVTVYAADLQPGTVYMFQGDKTTDGVDMFLDPYDAWMDDEFPGVVTYTWNAEGSAILRFSVSVKRSYRLRIVVQPDWKHASTASVAGRQFSWLVGYEPEYAGSYLAELGDLDVGDVRASFDGVAKLMNDGTTNFTLTVVANGMTYRFEDNGGGEVIDSRGRTFAMSLLSDNTLNIDGSFLLDGGDEVFFSGNLMGSLMPWSQSFLQFGDGATAVQMGIIADAFKNDSTESLDRLRTWASRWNVSIQRVNDEGVFSDNGDPYGILSEAYLLDCALTEAAVAIEKAKFVITKFDPKNGVEVTGGVKANGLYGNGTVQVRTSTEVGGTYDTSEKGSPDKLFYRAYLVK